MKNSFTSSYEVQASARRPVQYGVDKQLEDEATLFLRKHGFGRNGQPRSEHSQSVKAMSVGFITSGSRVG